MANHPNRGRSPKAARNPTPEEIRHIREGSELTQTAAANLLYCALSTWQQWEAPAGSVKHRRMHPAFWELFGHKARWHRHALQKARQAAASPPAVELAGGVVEP